MAEYLFRDMAKKAGLEVEVQSAGVAAYASAPAPEEALLVLARRDIDAKDHRARPLSPEQAEWADVILAMEEKHLRAIRLQYPAAAQKAQLLKTYVGAEGPAQIADPVGDTQPGYDRCGEELEKALSLLIEKFKSGGN
jgi:protein-tyrosine phosphatase